MMKRLFLTIQLRDDDDPTQIVEVVCDALTNATHLKAGELLEFTKVGDTILVFRSFPTVEFPERPIYPCENVGGD